MGNHVTTQGDVYSFGILLLEMFTGRRPTDDMFKDNLSLHSFVEMVLPERAEEIADPILLEHEMEVVGASENTNPSHSNESNVCKKTIEESLVSVFRIGVACSEELPWERLDMGDVVTQLQWIKNSLIRGRELHSHMHHE